MWNSPGHKRDLQLTPRQASGLTGVLDMELSFDDMKGHPTFMSGIGFTDIHPQIILHEAMKVIEALVTETPVPEGGHSALHEAILYGMCISLFEAASDRGADDEVILFKHELPAINAIRRLAKQRALKSMAHTDRDSWEMTLDSVFFWDRDWEMRELFTKGKPATTGAVKEKLDISEDYYDTDMKKPTKKEWEESLRRFRAIWQFAEKSPRTLPPKYLDRPEVGL